MQVPNAGPEPRLYSDLARWWPLLSPPSHYTEEANHLFSVLRTATEPPPRTLLELGAGGGSLAFHLKQELALTLSDCSSRMLEVSQNVNPECEHVLGDMRSLRLGREFDAVLIHDAIMYMTDAASVRKALQTAREHCRDGGVVVLVPDHVRETFTAGTSTGGEDAPDGRGLRYVEWRWDPDPLDTTYELAFAFLLREADGTVKADADWHRLGLFPRRQWLEWLGEAGFSPRVTADPWDRSIFVGLRTDRPA